MSRLQAAGLTRAFGRTRVLDAVDMRIEAGTVFGLVGRNGAGKTTLIRILLGILRADGGTLNVLDEDPWRHRRDMYRRMGVVLEHDGFWGALSFMHNMQIFAGAKGVDRAGLESYLHDWWRHSGLLQAGSRTARHFSRGRRMQCALCRAFLGWPELLLLDEPTVGLDVDAYEHFCVLVGEARRRGSAVLMSSHQLDTVESLCDEIRVLEDGVIKPVPQGAAKETAWYVAVRGDARTVSAAFEAAGATQVEAHAAGWRMRLAGGRETVPGLVAALVERGCGVEEIRPVSGHLRRLLRREAGRSRGGAA